MICSSAVQIAENILHSEGKRMAKKEKEKIFTEMQFNDAQYAQDVLEKSQSKLERCKIALIIALVAQIIWALAFFAPNALNKLPAFLQEVLTLVMFVGTLAAYIVGGGIKATVGFVWKMAKGISWIGWFLVPFPMDIVTGIASFFIILMFIPFVLLCVPLLGVAANYHQTSMDHKAAETYLSYCTPVAAAAGTTEATEE